MLLQGVLTREAHSCIISHMLEKLDKIDWSKLHHAYGPATDVPGQLRALALGDEQQRKRALYELHGNIWHQHTVYEATSFAVPFLVELVQNGIAEEDVLGLIALIAAGNSYLDVHESLLQRALTADDQRQLRSELSWVNAAKKAIAHHAPFFIALMASSGAKIRELCILILGLVETESEVTAAELLERIRGVE
jgi:hypothetical protein